MARQQPSKTVVAAAPSPAAALGRLPEGLTSWSTPAHRDKPQLDGAPTKHHRRRRRFGQRPTGEEVGIETSARRPRLVVTR